MRRQMIIGRIVKTLETIKEKKLDVEWDKFIYEISAQHGCSARKAKEYLEIARLKA